MYGWLLRLLQSKFDSYLASPDALIMTQCSMLLSAKLRYATTPPATALYDPTYYTLEVPVILGD